MARFTEVDATATELVKSFSEDPKKTGIDDFMRELLEFLKRFDRAQRENTARELKVRVHAYYCTQGAKLIWENRGKCVGTETTMLGQVTQRGA